MKKILLLLIVGLSFVFYSCNLSDSDDDKKDETTTEQPAGETPAGETPAGETPAGETPVVEVQEFTITGTTVVDKKTGTELFKVENWSDPADLVDFTVELNADGHVEVKLIKAGKNSWDLPLTLLNSTKGNKILTMEAKSSVAKDKEYPFFTGNSTELALTTEFTPIVIEYEHFQDTSKGDYWNLTYLGDGAVLTIKSFTITDK